MGRNSPGGGGEIRPVKRLLAWIAVPLVLAALVFLAYGSWQTARFLQSSLSVGQPTAQGSGWPAPEGPADIGYVGDPQAAFGYPFETVRLGTEIGDMPAWVIPAGGTSADGRWAIFVHGIGGRRENGYRFLPVLHEAGLPVLMLAYRNDAGAPPAPEGVYAFGLTEWRDIEAAVEHAVDAGAASVVIVAESMGGGIAGQFLRRSALARHVSAIVLDAPALDFPGLVTSSMAAQGVPLPGLLARGGMLLFDLRTGVDFSQASVLDDFAAYPGPLFLSHGAADRLVPVQTSDRLTEMRRGPTEYLRTQADHILSWKENPRRYDDALAAFLATSR